MFPATSSCCLCRNNMRSLAQRKPWLPQPLAISRWPWEVEWPVCAMARGIWCLGTGIIPRCINKSQPLLLCRLVGSPTRGDYSWCLFFPLNAPSSTRIISEACQPPAAGSPPWSWGSCFPADCSVTAEGPRAAPGSPTPTLPSPQS